MINLVKKEGNVMAFEISGKESADNAKLVEPAIKEAFEENDKMRFLFILNDFKGWDLMGFFNEIALGAKYYFKVEKIGIVGETKLEKVITKLDKPPELAKVKYFDMSDKDNAFE
ncbi:MAG: STAS/SEC14 domain-containing protein, partial [Candidatus Kapaibacterium sp.]